MAISENLMTVESATIKYEVTDKVKSDIIIALKSASGEYTSQKEDGSGSQTIQTQPFKDCDSDNIKKTLKIKSITAGGLPHTVDFTPIEAMISIIVDKVYEKLVKEMEVSMKDRMDTLENDYNLMLTTMATAGAGMMAAPLTPVGTAFTGIATAGGATVATPRTIKTEIEKALEITQLK